MLVFRDLNTNLRVKLEIAAFQISFSSLAQICSKGKSGVGVSVPIVICYLVKAILLFLQHE